MKLLRKTVPLLVLVLCGLASVAQETASVNGVADIRSGSYAFTNVTIVKDAQTTITNATLIIKNGKIVAVANKAAIPADAVVVDGTGKFIYPSFIDLFADYGIATPTRTAGAFNFFAQAQLSTNTKGAFGSNQAIKSEVNGANLFNTDEAKAKSLREIGFGVVLTHQKDGIARGTGAVVDLSERKENLAMLKEKAASFFSFNKGTSTQSYPGSLMGSIALLRQTFLDAQWYKNKPATEGTNLSLQAWNNNLNLPLIFEANDKWNDLRADRIGDEFGYQFIIKAGQNEYQRIAEVKGTKASYILPLNFPAAIDVEDPNDTRFVSLADLKQWEMAPTNPAAFEKAGINFCLTAADLRDPKQFLPNLRKAIQYGLSEKTALDALTKVPAQLLNMYNETGSIEVGKLANFIITNGPIFADKTTILQNWVQGEKYVVKDDAGTEARGKYNLTIYNSNGNKNFVIDVKDNTSADLILNDTIATKYSNDGKSVKINFNETKKAKKGYRLSGSNNGKQWNGTGTDSTGASIVWSADFVSDLVTKIDSARREKPVSIGTLTYPNMAYGYTEMPKATTVLIKNATVWTSEKEGILLNTDVLIENGKIAAVGKNLENKNATIVDGTGKHVTAGIIDEHSHIAAASINEGGQSVTSEVRIADNLDPDDVDIYRQLGGGVTTSHILHGSANTIGGQTQLIKHRWGANDTALKFAGADPFIKFALGENVKRTPAQSNNRFPDSRMGVEQVQIDAFTRAKDYATALRGPNGKLVRRDLELDALVEIMERKRFITCHSYIQSEIVETMRFAEKFGFNINTFTHILEGYKVADKMKTHGVNVSTFSDWWAYKVEVQDAIPYNAGIMSKMGLNVAINSDDPEMARRLNQEAAKIVKYSGISEEDALNMVTINPAKMLHIDKQVGSIKKGKDADIVLWSDNPLSIYAKAEKTYVDGILYYDLAMDAAMRKNIAAERNRLIQKLLDEKKDGGATTPARGSVRRVNECETYDHGHGLLDIEDDDQN
ncbi:amidohydrolase family protein [Ferruginibacter yonginensis]|uniref:Amidohydrolase family protein n=1 Tax=Ferruginibacter yonginensis TaxID=1310416 RepID=A0ABV8QUL2_9BACT